MDPGNDVQDGAQRISYDGSAGQLSPEAGKIKGKRFFASQPKGQPCDAGDRRSLRQTVTKVLPQQRSRIIQVVFFAGLLYAAFGFYNQNYLHWIDSPWFSSYSDRIAILGFGIFRIASEENAYTRRRLVVLVSAVTVLWLALPLFFNIHFFNHHTFGEPWFFIYLALIFLLGRRADCSWNCPCVGLRDTAGEPFRDRTIKGPFAFALQNLKWVALASTLPLFWTMVIQPDADWGPTYYLLFWTVHLNLYFISLFLIPLTGNRNYCRYLCPWGALYGLVGRVGFFQIRARKEQCVPCNLCEKACDMGIPLRQMIETQGRIKTPDCVGCGRCVQACPRGALVMEDVRDWAKRIARPEKSVLTGD